MTFLLGGVLIFLKDVVRITYIFFLFSTLDTFILVHGSCDHY